MKTILLTFAALVLSAQTVDTYYYSPGLQADNVTDDGRLNGAWWHFASPQERGLYVKAWEDITGRKLRGIPKPLDSVNAAVADELNRFIMVNPVTRGALNSKPWRIDTERYNVSNLGACPKARLIRRALCAARVPAPGAPVAPNCSNPVAEP